jgi:hypothetical protein
VRGAVDGAQHGRRCTDEKGLKRNKPLGEKVQVPVQAGREREGTKSE